MFTIYLLRHGETTWNADNNRYCGRTDVPLTQKGIQQAERIHALLQHIRFDGIYSSPLSRAKATAEIISGKSVVPDSRLIECDFGNWEGKNREEFMAEDPDAWKNWISDPAAYRAGNTGETGVEVVRRMNDFFHEKWLQFPSGNILAVAHNGVNRLFMAHRLGMPLCNYRQIVQENSAITICSIDREEIFTLHALNQR